VTQFLTEGANGRGNGYTQEVVDSIPLAQPLVQQ